MSDYTPRQVVGLLDRYIVGQDDAKKSVAIALRNRWRRRHAAADIRDEIVPNNIIMIGPTGVGKTEIARRLAKMVNAPFVKVEASNYTEVGYVGRDVETIIRDLVEISVGLVKEEHRVLTLDKVETSTENRLVDLLMPDPSAKLADNDEEAQARRDRTRDKLRAKLTAGELEERKVTLKSPGGPSPMIEIFSGPDNVTVVVLRIDGKEQVSGSSERFRDQQTLSLRRPKDGILKRVASKIAKLVGRSGKKR